MLTKPAREHAQGDDIEAVPGKDQGQFEDASAIGGFTIDGFLFGRYGSCVGGGWEGRVGGRVEAMGGGTDGMGCGQRDQYLLYWCIF